MSGPMDVLVRSVIAALLTPIALGIASAITYVPIDLVMTDKPEEARLELRFRNDTPHDLCISLGDWPTRGYLNFAADQVALIVDDKRFPIEDFNTGYCFAPNSEDGCTIRVKPKQTIAGFLRYQDFKLPEPLWSRPKKLVYSPNAYVCDKS